MSATITASTSGISVEAMTVLSPYEIAYQSRTIVLDLLGGGIAVGLQPSRPSSGTLEYLFDNREDAVACVYLHRDPDSFILTVDDGPDVGMTYVVDGTARLRLDAETLTTWIVAIDFQEIDPPEEP